MNTMTDKELLTQYQRMIGGEITRLKYCIMAAPEMTTVMLAEKSGVNKRTIDDYVSGRRDIRDMTLGKAIRIANVFKEYDPDFTVYDLIS